MGRRSNKQVELLRQQHPRQSAGDVAGDLTPDQAHIIAKACAEYRRNPSASNWIRLQTCLGQKYMGGALWQITGYTDS